MHINCNFTIISYEQFNIYHFILQKETCQVIKHFEKEIIFEFD